MEFLVTDILIRQPFVFEKFCHFVFQLLPEFLGSGFDSMGRDLELQGPLGAID
jgi:hypothetical protein